MPPSRRPTGLPGLRAKSLFTGDDVSDELRRGIGLIAPEQIFIARRCPASRPHGTAAARGTCLAADGQPAAAYARASAASGSAAFGASAGCWLARCSRPCFRALSCATASGAAVPPTSSISRTRPSTRYMHAGLPAGRRLVPQVAVPAPTRMRGAIEPHHRLSGAAARRPRRRPRRHRLRAGRGARPVRPAADAAAPGCRRRPRRHGAAGPPLHRQPLP